MKKEHWLIPIGIAGVVVTVWAALRNKSASPTVILQQSPSLANSVSPIGAPPVNYSVSPSSASSVQAAVPGTSASGVPNYSAQTQLQGGGVLQGAPLPASSRPSFYGPIQQFLASMIPVSDNTPAPAKSSCGCGGSVCGGCNDPCAATNSRYPDGRGACLAFNRKTQIAAMPIGMFAAASKNIATSGVDNFDVFQQTVFDYESQRNTVPASPFLHPV